MKIFKLISIALFFVFATSSIHAENTSLRGYFPSIEPYETGYLETNSEHVLYWEESGNPSGSPILMLHGGPGGGTNPDQRRFFDPAHYRIILFDQRGSGKSYPQGCLNNNTTWDLVDDIDRLLDHLKIDRCIIFGGSWGSTLALTYACEHPKRVKGLILRGIFLGRQKELDWFYKRGANAISPEAWNLFLDPIPQEEREDLIQSYYRYLTDDDLYTRMRAAASWAIWEYANIQLNLDERISDLLNSSILFNVYVAMYGRQVEPMARIECHYFINKCFFNSDNWILDHIQRIKSIPTIIVQGRYDLICPFENACELHQALPQSKLKIVIGGHASTEPEILDALIRATEEFKKLTVPAPKEHDDYVY